MKVLRHTIYSANPSGHGGERREAQLEELFCLNNITVNNLVLTGKSYTFRSACRAFCLILRSQNRQVILHPRLFYHYWKNWTLWINSLYEFFDRNKEVEIFLWESTGELNYIIAEEALRRGKKVIALPHNLETLVPKRKSPINGKQTPKNFLREINILKQCTKVYTISKEEMWILRLYGINASYLPYYPCIKMQERLLNIRNEREQHPTETTPHTLLMIGSAINTPTAIGMQVLIDYIAAEKLNVELRVAGYGTEELTKPNEANNITLLGAISDDVLYQEMTQCDAIVINQPPTSGALTRIVEAEIAGIPIIANTDSMRDYFNIAGIYEYRSMDELRHLMSTSLIAPDIPKKKGNDY